MQVMQPSMCVVSPPSHHPQAHAGEAARCSTIHIRYLPPPPRISHHLQHQYHFIVLNFTSMMFRCKKLLRISTSTFHLRKVKTPVL